MKLFVLFGLLFFSDYFSENIACDDLKITTTIIDTSEGKNNGKIEVIVEKGTPPYKVNLFATNRVNNKLDIKFEELQNLKSGKYILIVQHNGECVYQQTLVIN